MSREQEQDTRSVHENIPKKNGGVVAWIKGRFRRAALPILLGIGAGSSVGCGDHSPTRIEISGPGGGVVPIRVHRAEGDGAAKAVEGKEEEEQAPLSVTENGKVLMGVARVRADGALILHTEGKEHRFSFQAGQPLPPMIYTLSGTLHAIPGEAEGTRNIIFALRPLVGEWDPRRGVPPPTRFWKWEKTVTIRK